MTGFAWRPTEAFRKATNWQSLFQAENLPDYTRLAAKADADPEWFWDAVIKWLGFRMVKPWTRLLDLSEGLAFPKWCAGATTNMTLSCLEKNLEAGRGAKTAIVWEGEDGLRRAWTYSELATEVGRVAAGLRAIGVRKGDAVGLYLPMTPEAAAAVLAVARIGAVLVPLFSGFGAEAIATRLKDAEAVAVITADGCWRRGKKVDMKATMDEALEHLPSVRHVLVVPRFDGKVALKPGRDRLLADVAAAGQGLTGAEIVDAEAPLLLVYTSGTTGKPKGTVHTHVGFTVKTGLDFLICFDLKESDRLIWMTDLGWLVGPIQIIACCLAGATLVMAEGAPDFPENDRIWRLIEQEKVTFLGIGPTLARVLMRYGDEPVTKHDLSSLRIAASTGEPWDGASWNWVFDKVLGGKRPLMNYSGGTEMGGLVATNLLFPIKPASFFGPIPGTGADIVDETGQPVPPGVMGELVMTKPCIGTTRGLWRDRERYLESYWSRIPGIWVHGDWAMREADGTWIIHGRSDDTIKIGGKRTGPAEIEAILLATGKVSDAAVVGIPDATTGLAVACAVVAAPGEKPGPALLDALSAAVVTGMGPPFRPKRILVAGDLPKTRNMKTMRR
ncbi:MAG: AMP-binding protein, partial [Alphaproteobacteria bacterium]|nr:AMP-binding protein [Alphaproteobacteria bacterium]